MTLLIDDAQRNAALDYASQHPVQGMDPGFVARFSADYDAMVNANNVNARDLQRANIQSEFINRFYKESGVRVRNWLGGPQLTVFPDREAAARGQFDAWKKDNPDSDLFFPDGNYIDKTSLERSQAATQTSQRLQQSSTTWASALGGFAGTAVGALRDPLNALTAPLAGGAGGVVRTALTEGALAAGTQALGTGVSYNYRAQVDPNFGLGEAAYEVAAAGVGGAVLGGGLKGLAGLWDRVRTGEWPSHIADAANVVQREAAIPANRYEVTPQGKAIYRSAVDKASDDLFAGRPVELPPETFLQGQARPGRVYDADGRSVGVNYEVVEADSLTTSNLDDLSVNPAFPQELQPRDRTRAISQDQIQSIAGNLQPERLGPSPDAATGAPIIGPDDLVESGNGRVMAIRRAYEQGGTSADSYRNYLISQGYDIGDMAKPVLIGRRITDLSDADRLNFVTAANRSTAMRLGAAEQALSDGRMIDDALLDKLQGADVDATANRDFVRAFMQKLPRAEQSELVDRNGILSQQGERRVMAALMGRAYGDSNLLGRALEDADSNIKAISGAMGDSAAPWAKMRDAVTRGEIPKGMDITEDLLDAVRTVMRARDEGQKVGDLVNQAEMFGGPSETAKIIARAMYGDANLTRAVSRKRLAAFLDDYATEAMKNDAGPRLFGEPLEASDVLRTSLAKAGREDLGAVAAERLTPEEVEKIARSPETEDAVIQNARKLIADNEERQLGPIGVRASEAPESDWQKFIESRPDTFSIFDHPNPQARARELAEEARVANSELEKSIFGEEGAKKYQKLLRQENGSSPSAADAAAAERQKMEENLTPEQEKALFYSPKESDPDYWRAVADTLAEYSTDDPNALGDNLVYASRNFRPDVPWEAASTAQRMAALAVQTVGEDAQRLGVSLREVMDQVDAAARRRYSDPEDAEFMATKIKDALGQVAEPPRPNAEVRAISDARDIQRRTVEPIMIDLNDGRGERSLDEIMREADDEIAAAKEIESCAVGAPAEEM